MKLMASNNRKYSEKTIIQSFLIYLQSAITYEVIRDNNILILPNKRTLQRLSYLQNLCPSNLEGNKMYLAKQVRHLNPRQRKVILQIDEMYLKAQINYKAQKLTGYAENNADVAKTVLAFLISSAFGNFKEIVSLSPVNNLSGADLHDMTLKVLNLIQSLELQVIAIVTDNHRINQNMFSIFTQQSYKFLNPDFQNHYIFLMYDPVHLFKNIRNNSINRKDKEKSFYYSDFNKNELQIACFQDIRELYAEEENNILKKAYKLNKKFVFPSAFEKQNVQCVANIFHESTISALEIYSISNVRELGGTVEFLKIIKRWWNIVNCKSIIEGTKKREPYRLPIYTMNDPGIVFLQKFVSWIDKWIKLDLFDGGLSKPTFQAIRQTSIVLIELAETYLKSDDIHYIMFGKFQNDNVERRFSWYRRLSGCTFHVSYQEVLQSEKKLRLKNLIKGDGIDFRAIRLSSNFTMENIDSFNELFESDYMEIYELQFDRSVALYICGYATHSICKKLECDECQQLLSTGKGVSTDDDYFELIQRGGLSVPTEIVIFIFLHMSAVFHYISQHMKSLFLDPLRNQKNLLCKLTMQSLSIDTVTIDFDDTCVCGKELKDIYFTLFSIFANILLNNYSKLLNDSLESEKKRKLNIYQGSNKTSRLTES